MPGPKRGAGKKGPWFEGKSRPLGASPSPGRNRRRQPSPGGSNRHFPLPSSWFRRGKFGVEGLKWSTDWRIDYFRDNIHCNEYYTCMECILWKFDTLVREDKKKKEVNLITKYYISCRNLILLIFCILYCICIILFIILWNVCNDEYYMLYHRKRFHLIFLAKILNELLTRCEIKK